MKTMMKLSLVSAVLMVGCVRDAPIVYSHTDRGDWLTTESYGDNLADYSHLKSKAESMCVGEGHKFGVEILTAGPGRGARPDTASYTIGYKCKEEGTVDKIVSTYKEVEKRFGN